MEETQQDIVENEEKGREADKEAEEYQRHEN